MPPVKLRLDSAMRRFMPDWISGGDQHRHEDNMGEAEAAWRQAQQRDHGSAQLKVRLLLRRVICSEQPETSNPLQKTIYKRLEFNALHLPIREAWAHLRLAQMGRKEC